VASPSLVVAKHSLTSEFVGPQACSSLAAAIDMDWRRGRFVQQEKDPIELVLGGAVECRRKSGSCLSYNPPEWVSLSLQPFEW